MATTRLTGMDNRTGRTISGVQWLQRAAMDVLTTPLGSRPMRRDYGSEVPELIDQPDNAATRVRVYAASAQALMRWLPQLQIHSVALFSGEREGQAVLEISGDEADAAGDATALTLRVPISTAQGRVAA
jgi:phage baseplate assembly protein W